MSKRHFNTSTLLGMPDQIHVVLIKSDLTGDSTIISSSFFEWRSILTKSNCRSKKSVELHGIGNAS